MEPARVKLYGLVSVTRRAYRIQLAAAAVLLLGLLTLWLCLPVLRPAVGRDTTPAARAAWALLDYLPWVVLTLAGLFIIEAIIVFRRFAQVESKPSP